MFKPERLERCAFQGCPKPFIATLVIEGRDESVEHQLCYGHLAMAQTIANERPSFAHRQIPLQRAYPQRVH
jgi:hypothetical protein